ncbi:MAG: type I methionyl aminopeptidase [Zavarzinella sp.]
MLQTSSPHSIRLKTIEELRMMREAGKLVATALQMCRDMAKPGVSTRDIDAVVEEFYLKHNATSLFKGYKPAMSSVAYPAVTCISVNEQVVHGIPGNRILRNGDLLKVDTACKLNGWCADSAITIPIGNVRAERTRLMTVAYEVLQMAIDEIPRRRWWVDVAQRMQQHVEGAGFRMVQKYVGHGIGQTMHEAPEVPHFVNAEVIKVNNFRLEPGITLAVEPMVNMGEADVYVLPDNWTVVTKDGMPSAHVEHTLALTSHGIVVITAPPDDPRGIVPDTL